MFAVLDLGLDLDVWPWVWLGTAIVFALVELMFIGGSFLLLPFAGSAFVAAILAFYDVAVEIQWAVFVFGGGALFAALYQWARKFMSENTMAPGVGADRLVGMAGIVTAPIYPDDVSRSGRVALAGESWGAIVEGVDPIPEGAKVTVVSITGTRVIVKQLSPNPPASAGREDP